MKETILDVLLYLFENYFYDDPDAFDDVATMQAELHQAGFSPEQTRRAFDWLDGLAQQRPDGEPIALYHAAVRVFTESECARLDADSRGFLMYLEQHGILDAVQRERVIERAMALEQADLDLDDFKWVVLMVLFNQPGSEAVCAWLENQMVGSDAEPLH